MSIFTIRRLYIFILCLFSVNACFADMSSETLYLTWRRQPESTMLIQWISLKDEPENCIYYRLTDDEKWKQACGSIRPLTNKHPYLINSVELIDLKSDTLYEFKLSSDDQHSYFFRTMPKELNRPIKFVVGGDMYHGGNTTIFMEKTCLQAARTNPDFVLLGGDIAYATSNSRSEEKVERWIDWLQAWHACMLTKEGKMIPVISAIGNHDLEGHYDQTPEKAQIFATLFPMPGKQIYNCLDFGSYLSLIILDSGHANPVAGQQTQWLKSVLQDRSHIQHRFAIYHVPAYPSIRSFNNSRSRSIRKHWVSLFEKEQLKLVFEHHDHAYKRTFPLRNDKIDKSGVVYVGDGAWSVDEPRKMGFFKKLSYLAKFAPSRHFILMKIDADHVSMTSISDSGTVIDQYKYTQQ